LREANGTNARGLMNYIHELVGRLAEKRPVENAALFPSIQSGCIDVLLINVNSDVADYGNRAMGKAAT
jgi:hypothetical protein